MFATVLNSPIPFSSSFNSNQNPSKTQKGNNSFNKSSKFSVSKNHNNDGPIKMPTAPWMKGPLLLQPDEVLNASKPITRKSSNSHSKALEKALFGKESGVRGKKVMKKIIRNVEKLQGNEVLEESQIGGSEEFDSGNWLEEIGSERDVKRFDGKMPWMREEEELVFRRMKKEKVLTQAEISLDKYLLERLRKKATRMKKWVKVMKAGVTQAVVDEIRLAWREDELAMLKFSAPLCRNMDRAREIVEMKTGGLVVWNKKDAHVVYRGQNHALTSIFSIIENSDCTNGENETSSTVSHIAPGGDINTSPKKAKISTWERSLYREKESMPIGIFMKVDENDQPVIGSLYERETDRLLDGLGPRFIDWWMRKPLPVDADLLPDVVPGFRPPVRLSHAKTRPKLTDGELAYLRKLAHPLPFHFALGKNRNLQGLANAILKLWEKCLIAKIAIKWGIPNTDNEQMANELKLNGKIEKSAKKLAKLNSSWQPAELDADPEIITEEERECLRKMGLKLTSCLVLGRRGVFDGVIEGLHQHWKHREVVKVITMQKAFVRVIYTAKLLVAESGGILVSVEKLKEGHAIIIYRGKNYRRPSNLMTDNLLTKREALQRSIELQRIGSLKLFAYQRRQSIIDLKLKLENIKKDFIDVVVAHA